LANTIDRRVLGRDEAVEDPLDLGGKRGGHGADSITPRAPAVYHPVDFSQT
jgi:hypothetical protein